MDAKGLMTKRTDPRIVVNDAMIGRMVTGIESRTAYGVTYLVIVLEGGYEVAVMSDEEGNGGGVLTLEACSREFSKKHNLMFDVN